MGATLAACQAALKEGIAANLAGGTHHAEAGKGGGFCVFNDVAVAARVLQAQQGGDTPMKVAIVDLDVHQGNGTAAIFAGDASVFTLSLHGEKNFPLKKPPSSLDVPLRDGTGDDEYVALLAAHLPQAVERSRADIAFYLAGVDVAKGDRFGRLALSERGIALRDRTVLELVWAKGIATCLTLSGGYATGPDGKTSSERTAELHAIAHREAHRLLCRY